MLAWQKVVRGFRVGCPIMAIETSDPGNTIRGLCETFQTELESDPVAVVVWDCVQGLHAPSQSGNASARLAEAALTTIDGPENYGNPTMMLVELKRLPRRTVVVMVNAHLFLNEPTVKQAIWNLRDDFKASKKTLVLCGPSVVLPVELQHDVILITEPLPDAVALAGVVGDVAHAASECSGVTVTDEEIANAADAALGVTAFAAENLTSFAVTKDGLNVDDVWASKKAKINQTPGLRMIESTDLDGIGGVAQVKKFMRGIMAGQDQPNAIVFVDEIEKSIGGTSGDTSGVSQDQLGQLLQYMQDNNASGCIFVGPPGAAKSAIAKSVGSESGIPTIQLDLGGAKGSLVGESEAKIRDALKVVNAVSGGKTLWLATCNSLAVVPPELRRRFKLGTWFFDLPDLEERKAIWKIYATKYKVESDQYGKLLDREWTGAEIESCCQIAWRIGCSVEEAAEYIVPVAKAASEAIESLRSNAAGRLLDASFPGTYKRDRSSKTEPKARRFE